MRSPRVAAKRLVCVSNRVSLPRRGAPPGGLAVGLLAALRNTGGTWFGWSGETSEEPAADPKYWCETTSALPPSI